MATYTKVKLSGSTDGMGVLIAATATPGTTIHTADATAQDEMFIFISNLHTADVTLTIEFGGATDPDNLLTKLMVIPANSPPIPIVTGQILTNSKVVKMFAGAGFASKLVASGFVNRIT
jgi:hypothetical protein